MKKILHSMAGLFLAFLLIGTALVGAWAWQNWRDLNEPLQADQRYFMVERGESFGSVLNRLTEEGLNPRPFFIRVWGRIDPSIRDIKAGEYVVEPGDSALDLLRRIRRAQVAQHAVTIPEGWNMFQVAEAVEKAGLGSRTDFVRMVTDTTFVQSLGIRGATAEGYLYPDTYFFARGIGAERIVRAMVDRFWKSLPEDYDRRAAALGLTIPQAVTLASIIEKETGQASERRLISAVFNNRLTKRMRLQSDPTVIYGMSEFDGNIRKKDLLEHTAYNTYRIPGLPPGPIANPGIDALLAAVDPAPVPYLYFVSKNDGSHYFSSTLVEHNRAVNLYQRSGRRASSR